jgi:hypothetical protein
MKSDGSPLDDDEFRRLLHDCRFTTTGLRPGLIPFNAQCIAARLTKHSAMDHDKALLNLERWARALGGEMAEKEVLWLPATWLNVTPDSSP